MDEFREFIGDDSLLQTQVEISAVVARLAISAVLGVLLTMAYKSTLTGKRSYRPQMGYTLVLLCMGGALIWLVIGNSLVRAFGLGGALALIRYRTRVRDPKDMPMVLFAMIIGMACGLGLYEIACVGIAGISLVLAMIKLDWYWREKKAEEIPLSERPGVVDVWDDE